LSRPDKTAELSIYDISGKLVRSFKNLENDRVVWNASTLASGVYILQAKTRQGLFTKRLILAK